MPNWVTNTVKVDNFEVAKEKLLRKPTAEELKEDICLSEDSYIVDFNMLIPQPKDLEIIAGCYEWVVNKYNSDFLKDRVERQTIEITPIFEKLYDKEVTQDEFINRLNNVLALHLQTFIRVYDITETDKDKIREDIENIAKGYFNLQRHGATNWYDWNCKHWGTKWNGCEVLYVDEEQKIICFHTAYSTPLPVLFELGKYTGVTVAFADEDTGNNYGIYTCKDDNFNLLLSDENKSVGESMACRGECIENIDLLYGDEENYTDEEMENDFKTDRETFINQAHEDFIKTEELINNLFWYLNKRSVKFCNTSLSV